MSTVLVVTPGDARYRARLAADLESRFTLRMVSGWSAVTSALERRPVAAILVDTHSRDRLPFAQLAWLRRQHPNVATVIVLDPRGRELDLFRLGRQGVDEVALAEAGRLAPGELARALEVGLVRAAGRWVAVRLADRVPPLLAESLAWAVEHADGGPGPVDLARGLSRSLSRYRRELRQAGLPVPGQVLVWGRLLRAAHLLQDRGRSVDEVAHRVGYAAPTSLARAFRRETGRPPSEVRRRGGMAWVLEALLANRPIPRPPAPGPT